MVMASSAQSRQHTRDETVVLQAKQVKSNVVLRAVQQLQGRQARCSGRSRCNSTGLGWAGLGWAGLGWGVPRSSYCANLSTSLASSCCNGSCSTTQSFVKQHSSHFADPVVRVRWWPPCPLARPPCRTGVRWWRRWLRQSVLEPRSNSVAATWPSGVDSAVKYYLARRWDLLSGFLLLPEKVGTQ